MLTVLHYYSGDRDQAVRLADWIHELGDAKGHSLLLLRDHRTQPIPAFAQSFDSVEEIIITDDVWNLWPMSCNNAFKKAAKHIQYTNPQPWLWLEPDVVPMAPDWLDAITAEYAACGKPFLGDFVSVHTPELDVVDHMSGVAVYPGVMTNYAGLATVAVETAWDVFSADQILPQMATSALCMHSWKHLPFQDWDAVEREIFAFKPDCRLFHASKDGSLIELLRARRNPNLPVHTNESGPSAGVTLHRPAGEASIASQPSLGGQFISGVSHATAGDPPGRPVHSGRNETAAPELSPFPARFDLQPDGSLKMRPSPFFVPKPAPVVCDILIKSYPPDYELLGYCLRSIEKFATGFRQVILVVPDDHPPDEAKFLTKIPLKLVPVKEEGEGYMFQQVVKMSAHEYTDADYIMFIDSDTVLTHPVTPQTFFRDGKVLWMQTPYDDTEAPWRASTEKFLAEPVEFELMRRAPQFIPRSLHVSADVFCRVKHKMSIQEYILSQPGREFSEFNCLGALAYSRARDDFWWLNTSNTPESDWPERVAYQTWSREPLTPERRLEFETILADKVVPATDGKTYPLGAELPPGVECIRPGQHTLPAWEAKDKAVVRPLKTMPAPDPDLIVPWANPHESLEEIKRHCHRLAQFCRTPAHKHHVRTELAFAKVIAGKKYVKRAKLFRRKKVKYYFDENGKRIPAPKP